MKVSSVLTLAVVCALAAGCASNSKNKDIIPSPTPEVKEPVKLGAQGKVDAPLTIDVPPWYIKAPESTSEYVFVTGTAVSSSLAMSRSKAMLDAQYQLASKINGAIDAVMRQSRKDNDGKMTNDYTSLTVRKKIIDTSIAGHQLEDSRIVAENKGYRTFVLVRYPLGQANVFLNMRNQNESQEAQDKAIDQELNPAGPAKSSPTAAPVAPGAPVTVSPVSSADGPVRLLDVDNEEYKRRRAEALTKPGAVIGHVTVR